LDTTAVQRIKPVNDQHVEVVTNRGIFSATTIVLTCGPWTNKILEPLNLRLPLKVRCFSVRFDVWLFVFKILWLLIMVCCTKCR